MYTPITVKFRPVLFRASIVAALLFAFASTAHAQEAIVYVGKMPLNLRTGPGAAFPSLAELQPGEALHGYLQIEIIPADQPLVAEPVPGAHVTLTGAYVLDTEYGWMEIHPVWFVGP